MERRRAVSAKAVAVDVAGRQTSLDVLDLSRDDLRAI
jgi:hypothetical protein